jgi:hypothetical protein
MTGSLAAQAPSVDVKASKVSSFHLPLAAMMISPFRLRKSAARAPRPSKVE